jgi:hypothetical protein
VNGADAAALAAARECGLALGEASATTAADQLIADNNASASRVGSLKFTPGPAACSGAGNPDPDGHNTVTVTVKVPQQYFFAQIFGFNSGTVVASATAEWTPGGVANPVPLKLDLLNVVECNEGHTPGYTGAECFFAFENGGPMGGSDRGWLRFPQGWPVMGQDSNPMDCPSQAGGSQALGDYVQQIQQPVDGNAFVARLWDPTGAGNPPTYVCASGGVPHSVEDALLDWLESVSEMNPKPVVYFPAVACNGPTAPCHPWVTTSSNQSYPVVNLVGMRIENVWSRQQATQQENCTFESTGNDHFCIQLSVAGPDDPTIGGGGDPNVRLVG